MGLVLEREAICGTVIALDHHSMELEGRSIVVTGGASGMGCAMVRRFADEAPRGLVVVDLDERAASAVADEVGGLAVAADVGLEADILKVVDEAQLTYGPIDVWCSNAGVAGPSAGPEAPDGTWQRLWDVHVMSHVWAARALLPDMLERGEGYLFNTASAAGLLMSPGAMPYTVTKHAALSLAENLSVMYGEAGIRVSCLCPQLVATAMTAALDRSAAGRAVLASGACLTPEHVAEEVVAAMREERFLIAPHDEALRSARNRADDHERWLAGMRRIWTDAVAA